MPDQTKMDSMAERSAKARRLSLELRDKSRRDLAVQEIAEAFEATDGNAVHAADKLKISHRSLMRFVKECPQLERVVRGIRRKHGHPHEVGEPSRQKE
ncbi:MAG: hypothetical protein AMXMBFR56_65840 [Polyangiaceae bacterium]